MANTSIELCQATLEQDVDILNSIRGIGGKTAADFLIEMGGEIQSFETHSKLIAMAGLESFEIGIWEKYKDCKCKSKVSTVPTIR